jgi:pimeloyl-ACP methyl ester carboxylesterase
VTRARTGCAAAAGAVVVALGALLLLPEPAPGPVGTWMARAGVAPAFLDLPGARLRYVRKGGGPPVVLIHGFASSIYTWKDVLPALAAGHDVIAIDLPGFGGSSIPRPLLAASYPAVVLAVMDKLGVQRAALVGNSLGGSIAVALAAEHPERVDGIVLIDSAGFNFGSGDRPLLLRLLAAPGVGAAAERLPVRRRLTRAGLRQVFFDDALVTDERVDEYTVPMTRPGAARAAAELLGNPIPSDFDALVARVRTPTLVIWGREDTWIPVAHAGRFTAAIPGSTAVVLEACGHVPQEEKPAEVAALMRPFLAAAALD